MRREKRKPMAMDIAQKSACSSSHAVDSDDFARCRPSRCGRRLVALRRPRPAPVPEQPPRPEPSRLASPEPPRRASRRERETTYWKRTGEEETEGRGNKEGKNKKERKVKEKEKEKKQKKVNELLIFINCNS
jgi:hypothetical protein